MKLVAEQIEYLRKRKRELEGKRDEYIRYCTNRESTGLDGIGMPHFIDIQEEIIHENHRREQEEIDNILRRADYIIERNFDVIDIGTGFFIRFEESDSPERAMIIDSGTAINRPSLFASIDSDFGAAVIGHKAGDVVTYTVKELGRKITVHIDDIDRIKENYAHFIREKKISSRISKKAADELRELQESNPEEYEKMYMITPSQEELLHIEYGKIRNNPKDPKGTARKAVIKKTLEEAKIAPLPTGDRITIGSHASIMLEDGTEKNFEMINRAVSTETEGEYVERISPLGHAIFGLKAGQSFSILKKHQPSIKGMVTKVENYNEKERVR